MLLSFNITKQGKSHELGKKPGQDYSCCMKVRDNLSCQWVIAAVADGVGSCSNSQFGSKAAVDSVVNFLADSLRSVAEKNDEQLLQMLQNSYQNALDAVEEKADNMARPYITFDTTLTVAIFNGNDLYYGQSGDGGIVVLYMDGCFEMVTERQKGEESTSVRPLRDSDSWFFGRVKRKVASLALMTDGVLDAVVDEEMNNSIYVPFFRTILTADADSEEDEIVLRDYMDRIFSDEKYRERVTDDISFVAILDTEAISKLPEVPFDKEEWEKKAKEIRQKKQEVLDAQAKMYAQTKLEASSSSHKKSGKINFTDECKERGKDSKDEVIGTNTIDVQQEHMSGGFLRTIEGVADMGTKAGKVILRSCKRVEMKIGIYSSENKGDNNGTTRNKTTRN